MVDEQVPGQIGRLINNGPGASFHHQFVEHVLIVLGDVLVEEVDHIELLPEFRREANKLGLDDPVPLQAESPVGLARLRVRAHGPILHILNEGTRGVHRDGLVVPFGGLDVREHFLVGLADGRVFAMGRVDSCHTLIRVDEKHIRGRQSKCGFPGSRETGQDHDDVLFAEIHCFWFHNRHEVYSFQFSAMRSYLLNAKPFLYLYSL